MAAIVTLQANRTNEDWPDGHFDDAHTKVIDTFYTKTYVPHSLQVLITYLLISHYAAIFLFDYEIYSQNTLCRYVKRICSKQFFQS